MKIITDHIYPPIPDRRWDWSAVTEDYEPGHPQGFGKTESEAIGDLLDQLQDEFDEKCEEFKRLTA